MDIEQADDRDLILADSRIADGERKIEDQVARITTMRKGGQETADLERELKSLLARQDRREDRRDRLAGELGSPDY